jgi:hypothetical protein
MLEVVANNLKLKKGNTFIKISKYILTNLILDLHKSNIKIEVELYKDNILIDTKYIFFNEETEDVDINELIKKTHDILSNADI